MITYESLNAIFYNNNELSLNQDKILCNFSCLKRNLIFSTVFCIFIHETLNFQTEQKHENDPSVEMDLRCS